MTNLKEMKAAELKVMAKDLGVKNWWVLKKEDLITEIEKAQPQEEIVLPKLTALEDQMMRDIPKDNFYEDGLDSTLWTDCFLDDCSVGPKRGRGVISSLQSKGLLFISDPDTGREGNPTSFYLTNLGKKWMEENLDKEPPKVEPKKEAKEPQKAEEVNPEELVTLKDIIAEMGVKGTKARRILRNSEIERPFKRWEWHKDLHKAIIKQVKDLLK